MPAVYAAAFVCTVGGLVVFHVKTEDASEVGMVVAAAAAAGVDEERLLRSDGEVQEADG